MTYRTYIIGWLLALVAGCGSVQTAMAPGPSIIDLGEIKAVTARTAKLHPSVASWKLALGFSWSNQAPDKVTIKPGVRRLTTIANERIQTAVFTTGDTEIVARLLDAGLHESTFAITLAEFQQLYEADQVSLRVTQYEKTHEDNFGPNDSNPFMHKRMGQFLDKIAQVKAQMEAAES